MSESLYTTETPPSQVSEPGVTLGTVIIPAVDGQVTDLKWYCRPDKPSNEGAIPFILYDAATHVQLARMVVAGLTDTSWNFAHLTSPVDVVANQALIVATYVQGVYGYEGGYFNTEHVVGNLKAPATADIALGNGRYHADVEGYPESTWNGNNYWHDVVFVAASSGPTLKVWDGTVEISTTISVWDGTTEVAASLDSIV